MLENMTPGRRSRGRTRSAAIGLILALASPAFSPLVTSSADASHRCQCGCESEPGERCGCCPERPAAGTVCISDGGCGGQAPLEVRLDQPGRAALLPVIPSLLRRVADEQWCPGADRSLHQVVQELPDPVPRLV